MNNEQIIKELTAKLEKMHPEHRIVMRNNRTMISNHWFVYLQSTPDGPLQEIGSDYTEVTALKNALAVSESLIPAKVSF
ncbi:hypothetical protein SAMN05421771_0065 [Granulicella pectinivorans]|jgi:hypothetical protein|uniref:Uncharacterized protein n=1 Tax=Granulicella pectinivorans TaxID=474950 RepID=A0A1I6L136_9BACT|nr:hypothetical protein [Granulicella pectinivorans]SFR96940.1 hypothetical protein SAMN05421771_0065 [Granulicella pectinivorans]